MYPTLRGSMQTELNTPHIFLPDKVPIISQHESHQLQELTMPTLQALDSIRSHLTTPLHSIDIDSLLHIHQTSRNSQTEIRWHKFVIILTTIILLLGLLYFLLRSHFDKMRCATTKAQDTTSVTSAQNRLQRHQTPEPRPRDTEHMSCSQVTHYNTRTKAAALDVYQSDPEQTQQITHPAAHTR